jgi:hypothetical protein
VRLENVVFEAQTIPRKSPGLVKISRKNIDRVITKQIPCSSLGHANVPQRCFSTKV